MESFLSYRGSPKSSTIFGGLSSLIPSGKRLQKPNWKDPPCYYIMGKSMINQWPCSIFSSSQTVDITRGYHPTHLGFPHFPLRASFWITWIQHAPMPQSSRCKSPPAALPHWPPWRRRKRGPPPRPRFHRGFPRRATDDQVCKRCLPGLVSTVTKSELERSSRLFLMGKLTKFLWAMFNSYKKKIPEAIRLVWYNPANQSLKKLVGVKTNLAIRHLQS